MKRKILKLDHGTIKKSVEPDNKNKRLEADRKRLNRALAQAMELGLSIVLPIVAGVLFGRYLDHLFGTSPILTLSFLFLGVIIGSIQIVKLARKDAV
jgi:ATP synthase protein I